MKKIKSEQAILPNPCLEEEEEEEGNNFILLYTTSLPLLYFCLGAGNFLLATASRPTLGPTQPPIQ
jgi:hypothetical protein